MWLSESGTFTRLTGAVFITGYIKHSTELLQLYSLQLATIGA